MEIPNVSGPVAVTEEEVEEVTVARVMSDSARRLVTGFIVPFLVGVASGWGRGTDLLQSLPSGTGGSVNVGTMSVGVTSTPVCSVWLMMGVGGTLPICVVSAPLAETGEENADVAGLLAASRLVGFPTLCSGLWKKEG